MQYIAGTLIIERKRMRPCIKPGQLEKIKVIVSDVDGVLTDGKLYLGAGVEEIKAFSSKDAPRMVVAMRSGLKIVWFTARKCQAVIRRSAEIIGGVQLLFKGELSHQKINLLDLLKKDYGVDPEEVMYLGDDWSDLHIMKQAGVAVTPSDGSKENKDIAHVVTTARGGEGVMAEAVEILMRAQGTWEKYTEEYISNFVFKG